MGFRFRKSVNIIPGLKVNLGNKGVNSISIGKRGAKVNIGKKGIRSTVGMNGTGLSYSKYSRYAARPHVQSNNLLAHYEKVPKIYVVLNFLFPFAFLWFIILSRKYSPTAKLVAFGWFFLYMLIMNLINH